MKTDALRFKRQHPIGPYVVDFCCTSVKLIIEVSRNGEPIRPPDAYDQMRIGYLEAAGYNVLRFSEDDIREHTEQIVTAVRAIISMSQATN
jgi:very-short-patch-repair endonuclease